jgi:heat shock protein HslJ
LFNNGLLEITWGRPLAAPFFQMRLGFTKSELMMVCAWPAWRPLVLILLAVTAPAAADDSFPFGTTLMLDAAPMRGSKRVPMLEIAEDGALSIDLWCASATAKAVVSDDSITIALWNSSNVQCAPERQARDAELLAALAEVIKWRRKGEVIEFSGATPLRFRLMTN